MRKALTPAPTIHPSADVSDSQLGRWTEVAARTSVKESRMDDYSYVMQDSQIIYTMIGKFCSIASQVRINPGNHPLDRAALHHFTYRADQFGLGSDDDDFFNWRRQFPVTLGHDVWIGHGAVVLPGVTIGTGAAIGAGAIVTKDIEPFQVAVGNPARVVRDRFEPDVKAALLQIRWWDWTADQLSAALGDFQSLDGSAFVEKHAPKHQKQLPVLVGAQQIQDS